MVRNNEQQSPGNDPRKALPQVSALLETPPIAALLETHPRPLVLDAARTALDTLRSELKPGSVPPTTEEVAARVLGVLANLELDRLRPVVNATGVLLHTGLGRAVLPEQAAKALATLDRCCNLQVDLETGRRGKRNYLTEQLLCRLTGAEAAMVVNNNAAATLLVLTALCHNLEVIVSRGQLIEIGGSFRLPDCVYQSGATLIEVGTTNKTHLRDYEGALTEDTAAIMRVNPSNYRVVGFSKEVPIEDLVTLKRHHDVLVIDDLGCGALIDLTQFGLPHEPTVPESIAAGADVALFSGDKLIGGPQAGIIVGKKPLIQQIKKHPLTRMLRVGKLTDLALEQTLRLFLTPAKLAEQHPTIRILTVPVDKVRRQARDLARRIEALDAGFTIDVRQDESAVGGGSLPASPLPTFVVALRHPDKSAETLAAALRRNEPPIIARIAHDDVVLDVRTLMTGDAERVVKALEKWGH